MEYKYRTDKLQMSFDLDALFQERMEVFPPVASASPRDTCTKSETTTKTHLASSNIDSHVKDMIQSLIGERNQWQAQAKEYGKMNKDLERRIYDKRVLQKENQPLDVVRRMDRLQIENSRLQTELAHLKENLKAAECENTTLCDENAGQIRKLKGANKKMKNAKEVAGKEEAKAKNAMHDKQQRVSSERRMKKERNDALAMCEEQKKMNEKLRAELEIECSGRPHLRASETGTDEVAAIIPVEIWICREDFRTLLTAFESYQTSMTDRINGWYGAWKKAKKEGRHVIGATHVGEEKTDIDLYEDMVEDLEHLQTGV